METNTPNTDQQQTADNVIAMMPAAPVPPVVNVARVSALLDKTQEVHWKIDEHNTLVMVVYASKYSFDAYDQLRLDINNAKARAELIENLEADIEDIKAELADVEHDLGRMSADTSALELQRQSLEDELEKAQERLASEKEIHEKNLPIDILIRWLLPLIESWNFEALDYLVNDEGKKVPIPGTEHIIPLTHRGLRKEVPYQVLDHLASLIVEELTVGKKKGTRSTSGSKRRAR